MGYTIEASATSQLIEIRRVASLPVGTTIEAEVSSESAKVLDLDEEEYSDYSGPGSNIDWFCWDWPNVTKRVIRGPKPELLKQEYVCPVRKSNLPPEWSVIHPEGFDAVFWTFWNQPYLSCNGLRVADPSYGSISDCEFSWPEHTQLRRPCIAVLDSAANLPLTTQRYELAQETVPFVDELARDVSLSFIAHALVCGPTSPQEALTTRSRHPLQSELISQYDERRAYEQPFADGLLRWCFTSEGMVPADPWLYKLLNTESCLLYGTLRIDEPPFGPNLSFLASLSERARETGHAILPWLGFLRTHDNTRDERVANSRGWPEYMFGVMAREGVKFLGPVSASHVMVYVGHGLGFDPEMQQRRPWVPLKIRHKTTPWRETHRSNSRGCFFEAHTGRLNPAFPLEPFLEAMETARESDGFLFLAEIRPAGVNSPESMIAKIWNECLGPKSIPFDPVARKALIAEGCKHPELKRHIEAWKEMKRTGSKWVTGG